MGHVGESHEQLLSDARSLQNAGVFSMVLENVESDTAQEISEAVSVPTIGIGSGNGTTGQVQVLHDLLGLSLKPPPFAKPFADLRNPALDAIREYVNAVRGGRL